MEMTVFWYVAPCSLVEIDRRFRGVYCLHHQSVGQFLQDYTAQHPRRQSSSSSIWRPDSCVSYAHFLVSVTLSYVCIWSSDKIGRRALLIGLFTLRHLFDVGGGGSWGRARLLRSAVCAVPIPGDHSPSLAQHADYSLSYHGPEIVCPLRNERRDNGEFYFLVCII
jgi:hypothetical protein